MNFVKKVRGIALVSCVVIGLPILGAAESIDSAKQLRLNRSLFLAIKCKKSLDYIKLLIESGAEIHAENHQGVTPVEYAQGQKRLDVVEFLSSLESLHC